MNLFAPNPVSFLLSQNPTLIGANSFSWITRIVEAVFGCRGRGCSSGTILIRLAMLPYGIVRYHGAPADLRDVPLGTVMHVCAFLPPDPTTSSVPVLPVDNKSQDANHNRGAGIAPAENHVLLLEDEPSFCLRNGLVWKLKKIELQNNAGMITATREQRDGSSGEKPSTESLTFDAATRIWRGRELLLVEDLVSEGSWPAQGKKSLEDQAVLLGITWKPTPDGVFTRFHVSDIWLDAASMSELPKIRQKSTKPSFEVAGCPPGSMPWSTASLATRL